LKLSYKMAQYPQRIGEPDCRDYLRTGRCKYGDSCKYHHPPNVQSGGGIKTPLNPSEPPFPIRPNEPPCQYYLKHGTCKFGQTCKFHHPPNVVAASGSNSLPGTVLVNVGGMNILTKPCQPNTQGGRGQHILLNTNGAEITDHSQQGQMLQILPQRPTEPDCIYFLRNGRCKYGATCKYHHPMGATSAQQFEPNESGRKHQTIQLQLQSHAMTGRGRAYSTGSVSEVNNIRALQLVQQSSAGHGPHGRNAHSQQYVNNSSTGPTHILVADGPIAVMTVDQRAPAPASYHQVSNVGGQLYTQPAGSSGSDVGDNLHEHSPLMTSSVASSYETAASSYEFMAQGNVSQQIPIDAGGALWQRTNSQQHLSSMGGPHRQGNDTLRPSGSGNSLHAYQTADTISASQTHGHYGSISNNRVHGARTTGGMTNDGFFQHPPSSLRRAVDAASRSSQQQEQERRLRAVSVSSVGSTGESSLMYSSVNEDVASTGHEPIARGWPSSASLPTSTIHIAPDRNQTLWEEQDPNRDVRYCHDSTNLDISENVLPTNMARRQNSGNFRSHAANNSKVSQREDKHSNLEDDGLSLMASALLNMLDTPDEDGNQQQTQQEPVAAANFHADSTSNHVSLSTSRRKPSSSTPATPNFGNIGRPRTTMFVDDTAHINANIGDHPLQYGTGQFSQMYFQNSHSSQMLGVDFTGNSLPSYHQVQYPEARFCVEVAGSDQKSSLSDRANALPARWSPTLCETDSGTRQLERNAQSVSALQRPPSTPHSASQAPPNIGLFLS